MTEGQETKRNEIQDSQRKVEKKILPEDLSEEAKRLFSVLEDKPQHIDILAQRAELSIREALAAVTELEMEELIFSFPGKLYANG